MSKVVSHTCMIVVAAMATTAFLGNAEKALAITYTSLKNGLYTNNTDVWSTNGSTACGCNPGTTISSIVNVNHVINMNADLTVASGGQINIFSGDALTNSTKKLTISGGTLLSYGTVEVKEIFISSSGSGSFYGS